MGLKTYDTFIDYKDDVAEMIKAEGGIPHSQSNAWLKLTDNMTSDRAQDITNYLSREQDTIVDYIADHLEDDTHSIRISAHGSKQELLSSSSDQASAYKVHGMLVIIAIGVEHFAEILTVSAAF